MEEKKTNITPLKQISNFMNGESIKAKFAEMLGSRAPQFISSVMSAVNANPMLQNATPHSVYGAALMAATLDLPVNGNLGFAYIVPYNSKKRNPATGKDEFVNEAQFQMGSKGMIQLAMRSGQYLKINVAPIREGQMEIINPITEEYKFSSVKPDAKVIGYIAYFKLLNGFEKYLYMTNEELLAHGKKYSKTFSKYGSGLWKDNFEAMAKKTVIKLLLSKFGILSIEMQKAQIFDQAVVNKSEDEDAEIQDAQVIYVDNDGEDAPTEEEAAQISENAAKVAEAMSKQ